VIFSQPISGRDTAWRIADNSIPSARTVVDFLFKVQDKIF